MEVEDDGEWTLACRCVDENGNLVAFVAGDLNAVGDLADWHRRFLRAGGAGEELGRVFCRELLAGILRGEIDDGRAGDGLEEIDDLLHLWIERGLKLGWRERGGRDGCGRDGHNGPRNEEDKARAAADRLSSGEMHTSRR